MKLIFPDRRASDALWQPYRRFRLPGLPPTLLDWLLDSGSLTQRVRSTCSGRFRVELLGQHWVRPLDNEARILGMRRGTRALVRHVRLLCDEVPWVFARTVIPRRSLRGRQRRLGRLGTRPLGAVLFADRSMRRGEVEVARLRGEDALFRLAAAGFESPPAEVWGRRSIFHVGGKPLLVSEFFLPDIVNRQGK